MPYFYVGTINIEGMRNMIIDKVSGKSRLGKQIKAPGCNALGQGNMSLDSWNTFPPMTSVSPYVRWGSGQSDLSELSALLLRAVINQQIIAALPFHFISPL